MKPTFQKGYVTAKAPRRVRGDHRTIGTAHKRYTFVQATPENARLKYKGGRRVKCAYV